jgi:hypothetical protein
MKRFKLDEMVVEATFIREKYDFFRWDFNIYKQGNLVASAADYNSRFADAKKAAREFWDEISQEEVE